MDFITFINEISVKYSLFCKIKPCYSHCSADRARHFHLQEALTFRLYFIVLPAAYSSDIPDHGCKHLPMPFKL